MTAKQVVSIRTRRAPRRRRGISLVEIILSAGIGLIVLMPICTFSAASSEIFSGDKAGFGGQQEVVKAMHYFSKDVRAATSLVSGTNLGASKPTLVLQMPAYNTDGSLKVPVTSGHTVTYSISDDGKRFIRTESGVGSSTILEASSTGSFTWAMGYYGLDKNANSAIDLTEYITLIPSLTLKEKVTSGTSAYDKTFKLSEEIMLRNR